MATVYAGPEKCKSYFVLSPCHHGVCGTQYAGLHVVLHSTPPANAYCNTPPSAGLMHRGPRAEAFPVHDMTNSGSIDKNHAATANDEL